MVDKFPVVKMDGSLGSSLTYLLPNRNEDKSQIHSTSYDKETVSRTYLVLQNLSFPSFGNFWQYLSLKSHKGACNNILAKFQEWMNAAVTFWIEFLSDC